MVCPMCTGSFSIDYSVIEQGKRVSLQGKIKAIMDPRDSHVPPFSDFYTVTLYPRTGKVKYLKFRTKDELEQWGFIPDQRIQCRGCLHIVDEKELVFDVQNVIEIV